MRKYPTAAGPIPVHEYGTAMACIVLQMPIICADFPAVSFQRACTSPTRKRVHFFGFHKQNTLACSVGLVLDKLSQQFPPA